MVIQSEILEQTHVEQDDIDLKRSLLTFVVVGGGFNGIETVGELTDFIKDTVKVYYKNISMSEVRIFLVNSSDKILKQVDEELGQFALEKLKEMGVEFRNNGIHSSRPRGSWEEPSYQPWCGGA